jgi:PAS domain S-box-containing protein
MPESVVITDTSGKIQFVNPAFTKVTGYLPEEVIGQNPRILKSGRQDPRFYRKHVGNHRKKQSLAGRNLESKEKRREFIQNG